MKLHPLSSKKLQIYQLFSIKANIELHRHGTNSDPELFCQHKQFFPLYYKRVWRKRKLNQFSQLWYTKLKAKNWPKPEYTVLILREQSWCIIHSPREWWNWREQKLRYTRMAFIMSTRLMFKYIVAFISLRLWMTFQYFSWALTVPAIFWIFSPIREQNLSWVTNTRYKNGLKQSYAAQRKCLHSLVYYNKWTP